MSSLDFIYKRKSIRKFSDKAVKKEDLLEMIRAATYAPSGTNSQNWHFVVVTDKRKINAMAEAVEKKNIEFQSYTDDKEKAEKFGKFLYYQTLFKNAPAVVLVYASEYPVKVTSFLKDKGASMDEIHELLRHSPGIQNIGAAMENLLLAAANLGYGGCWMTAPMFAGKAISTAIGFEKEGYHLTCMSPIGVPSNDNHPQPVRKPVSEVSTFIE